MSLVLVVLLGCTPAGGDDLLAAYQAFDAPTSWALLSQDEVTEPICLTDGCQSSVARWSTDDAPSSADLTALLVDAGYADVAVQEDCAPHSSRTGPIAWCTGSARAGDHDVELRATGPIPGEAPAHRVVLTIS